VVEGGGERVGGDAGGGGVSWVLGRGGFCFEGNGVWRDCVWDGVWLRFGPGAGMIPRAVGYDSWEWRSGRI
jgi:hypothetical protein